MAREIPELSESSWRLRGKYLGCLAVTVFPKVSPYIHYTSYTLRRLTLPSSVQAGKYISILILNNTSFQKIVLFLILLKDMDDVYGQCNPVWI